MQDMHANDEQIDISALLKVFWRSRWLIIGGTGFVTLFAVIWVLALPKSYLSSGFYLAKLKALDYKLNRGSLTDPERLAAFLAREKTLDPRALESLQASIENSSDISRLLAPVPSENTDIIGFNISAQSNTPKEAEKIVLALGSFIKDSLLYEGLYKYIHSSLLQSSEALETVNNAILENSFTERQLIEKRIDLKKLSREFPHVPVEVLQVFTIKNQDYRYLSPATELFKIEVALSDLRQERMRLLRGKEIIEMKKDFFAGASDMLNKNRGEGSLLFSQILDLKERFIKNSDLSKDTIKEFLNTLPSDINTLHKKHTPDFDLTEMHFTYGPSLPRRKISSHGKNIVLGYFFMSLSGFSILAVLLAWWRKNKSLIIDPV